MSKVKEVKQSLKKEKSKVQQDIVSLKKTLKEYKAERKANWKSFKNKIKGEICLLKKQK